MQRAREYNCDSLGFTQGVLAEMNAAGAGPRSVDRTSQRHDVNDLPAKQHTPDGSPAR